jgi:hypothetical protein
LKEAGCKLSTVEGALVADELESAAKIGTRSSTGSVLSEVFFRSRPIPTVSMTILDWESELDGTETILRRFTCPDVQTPRKNQHKSVQLNSTSKCNQKCTTRGIAQIIVQLSTLRTAKANFHQKVKKILCYIRATGNHNPTAYSTKTGGRYSTGRQHEVRDIEQLAQPAFTIREPTTHTVCSC